jgi:Leucine-rich repeat (LRR) protein
VLPDLEQINLRGCMIEDPAGLVEFFYVNFRNLSMLDLRENPVLNRVSQFKHKLTLFLP